MRRLTIALAVVALAVVGVMRPWSHGNPARSLEQAKPPLALIDAIRGQQPGPHAIDETTVRGRGVFRDDEGGAFSVGQGVTEDHQNQCVVAAGAESTGIACDPAPFADSPVQLVESFSAGPGGKPFRTWQVSGIAQASVGRIELLDSKRRHRPVELSTGNAFFFELSRADLARGITAVSLLVYGPDGGLMKEVDL
jgi:hypothetical protein